MVMLGFIIWAIGVLGYIFGKKSETKIISRVLMVIGPVILLIVNILAGCIISILLLISVIYINFKDLKACEKKYKITCKEAFRLFIARDPQ